MLEQAGVEYEDVRYDSPDKWFSVKHKRGFDLPNLPWFDDGVVKLTQSGAILRYVAELHGFRGKDAVENAHLDMLHGEAIDIHIPYLRKVYSPDFEKQKDELRKIIVMKLEGLEKYLEGKKFFGGETVKFPDFHLYEIIYQNSILFPDLLDKFPNIKSYLKRFEELPRIKAYMESDRFLKYPFNGPSAKFGGK